MADNLRDATKKVDFISREELHKANRDEWQGVYGFVDCDIFEDNENMIDRVPAADVVARDCYDRVLAENDTMRKQLAQIGKKAGDTMDDVRPVVKAHWIYHEDDYGDYYECSHCHDEYVVYECDMCWKHCPTCGAEMEPDEAGQRGENDSG